MAFIDPKDVPPQKMIIDLQGPNGNAYVLLSHARALGKVLGFDADQLKSVSQEMRQKDYVHLVKTFDKYFGDLVDLLLPQNWSWEGQETIEDVYPDVEVVVVKKPHKPKK